MSAFPNSRDTVSFAVHADNAYIIIIYLPAPVNRPSFSNQSTDCPSQNHMGPTHFQSRFSCPILGLPLLSPVLTHIDPTMLHRGWDGPEEPTPKAQTLVVEIPHDLMAFTIDTGGTQGTSHQRQPPSDLMAKAK